MPRVLYIVYWGLLEPLGKSLVFPAVKKMAQMGVDLTLVTFEKPKDLASDEEMERARLELGKHNIEWLPLQYHKTPKLPATSFDIFHGIARGLLKRLGKKKFDIIHGRTYLGGLIGVALAPIIGAKFIYHNEGFYPDEQVDNGIWKKNSFTHRVAKNLENLMYAKADAIIALSQQAKSIIENLPEVRRKATPVLLVPSCVDLRHFNLREEQNHSQSDKFKFVYIGSAGGRYIFDKIGRFIAVARKINPNVHLQIYSKSDRNLIKRMLNDGGLSEEAWTLEESTYEEMPRNLAKHAVGLSFLATGISEHGGSPTKVGEYWATGLPVLTTPNAGDTDQIIKSDRVGIVIKKHSDEEYRSAFSEIQNLLLDADIHNRCRLSAEQHYALSPACASQLELYNKLVSPKSLAVVGENHTLYVCYFGLREPLVQTQVLPYLRELLKDDINASILTFEPNFSKTWTSAQVEDTRRKLADEGIDWYCLPYHKYPTVPATAFDIFSGARFIQKIIESKNINVLHARTHVPAMMALWAKNLSYKKPKILFDIRGFIPEEYADAGRWKENGLIYNTVKKFEKHIFTKSDAFVVLTEKAQNILFPESAQTGSDRHGRAVEVIPCCVDLQKFDKVNGTTRGKIRAELNLDGRYVVSYVGSFGGWYMTEEMIDFFAAARQHNPKAFALILTQRDKEKIVERLKQRGFAENDFLVTSVLSSEIPSYLSAADVALSFIQACYSKQASSPTKIAEYLASGLPIILNSGVGDLDKQIKDDNVGIFIKDFSEKSYLDALSQVALLENQASDFAERCRLSAKKRFDLVDVGGAKYRSLYQRLLSQKG